MSVFSVGPSRPWGMRCGRLARLVEGSLGQLLSGGTRQIHPAGQAIGAELFGGRSPRPGDWKLLDMGNGK